MTTTRPEPGVRVRPRRSTWLLLVLTVALVLALVVRSFVLQTFSIPSDSMSPTLAPGERVLVWRVGAADVERGDVIVFDGTGTFVDSPPEPAGLARVGAGVGALLGFRPGESDFVKRVVGVGGDRVTCCDDAGHLLVNGVPVEETYVHPGDAASDVEFDIVVPDGRLWVMGDHRSDSVDSRSHLGSPGGGTVALHDVVGRVVAISWPPSAAGAVRRQGES